MRNSTLDVGYRLVSSGGRGESLSDNEFRLFSDLIGEECGVKIGAEKRMFLESRLRRRMAEIGLDSVFEYYQFVRGPKTRSRELPALLDVLMICETSFFRNSPQFELLKGTVLPDVIARKSRTNARSLRIWSAGCSTGQEPYSVAMTSLEATREFGDWVVRVFASDLSFTALERAQCGVYRVDQVKEVENTVRSRYFREQRGNFLISDQVKSCVIFDYHNLKHDNGLRGLDVIFCRNVLIYFDVEDQRRLIDRFTKCLVPGGFLFLGHAESLQGLSTRFTMVHQNKGIAYRLEG
jgi:chemotaxis protein methyltransferase CheR